MATPVFRRIGRNGSPHRASGPCLAEVDGRRGVPVLELQSLLRRATFEDLPDECVPAPQPGRFVKVGVLSGAKSMPPQLFRHRSRNVHVHSARSVDESVTLTVLETPARKFASSSGAKLAMRSSSDRTGPGTDRTRCWGCSLYCSTNLYHAPIRANASRRYRKTSVHKPRSLRNKSTVTAPQNATPNVSAASAARFDRPAPARPARPRTSQPQNDSFGHVDAPLLLHILEATVGIRRQRLLKTSSGFSRCCPGARLPRRCERYDRLIVDERRLVRLWSAAKASGS